MIDRVVGSRGPAVALARGLCAVAAVAALGGCAALVVGGAAVGGAMVATDRRTSGALVEDEAIEYKAASRIKAALEGRGHVNVTSYNRIALLTGEVPSEADRSAAEQAATRVEGVRSVVNELAELPNTSLGARSNDALLATKVKATLFDIKGTAAHAFKVVVERNIVYLMGRATDAEAAQVAELASAIPGVQKVVRVFEILTEEDIRAMQGR